MVLQLPTTYSAAVARRSRHSSHLFANKNVCTNVAPFLTCDTFSGACNGPRIVLQLLRHTHGTFFRHTRNTADFLLWDSKNQTSQRPATHSQEQHNICLQTYLQASYGVPRNSQDYQDIYSRRLRHSKTFVGYTCEFCE